MLEEVRSHLLAEILHETQQAQDPGDQAFLQRLAKVLVTSDLNLPPFPSIARELDNLLFRGDPSVIEVTAVVERDPGLLREVWLRASGANFRKPPSRLDEAIARIGFTDLWRIAMQMSMQSPVFRAGSFQQEAESIHEHGVLCADIAAQLSREPRGNAYLAGLLHDVGKLVIFRAAGGSGKEKPNTTLVERMVQNHHSSIGMLAARSWNLGADVEFAIGFHHHPPVAMIGRPGPLGPTAIAEAAVHIAGIERGHHKNDNGMAVPVFGELPEEVREAVLAAHRLMDMREGRKPSGRR
jgi:HD-like signal output (HDOD) protein